MTGTMDRFEYEWASHLTVRAYFISLVYISFVQRVLPLSIDKR